MMSPKISVIIPTRNRLEMLKSAIESVLHQTEQDFELIVVDDGSTDGTRAYVEAMAAKNPRIKLIHNSEPSGGAEARNQGIAASTGRWIAFLDDDDEWLPGKLSLQLAILASNPSAVACSSSYLRRDSLGTTTLIQVPRTATFDDLLWGSIMGGASVCLCNAQAVRRIGGYDRAFRSGQDWDLWVRLSQVGRVVSCTEPTVIYRAHDRIRITNDMYAQYQGARHFYFKYRHLMTRSLKTHRLAYLCFVMSRQRNRSFRRRCKFLGLAMRKTEARIALRYAISSVPRLLRDMPIWRHATGA